jgi:hypothetical protein
MLGHRSVPIVSTPKSTAITEIRDSKETRMRIRPRRLVVVGVLAIAVGSGVFAYAATNTVPGSSAGAGSGAISGYAVSNIQYTIDSTTPTNLNQVSFTISPAAASVVKAQLSASGAWYNCTNSTGSVTCATTSPQATVAGATQLTVVSTE